MTSVQSIDKKEINKLVIKTLKKYRALKVQNENRHEQELEGVVDLFPTIKKNDLQKEMTGKKNIIKVKQVDRALSLLDDIEREIIDMKFLSPVKQTDLYIYTEMGIKKEMYYEKKREALDTLATALGIE